MKADYLSYSRAVSVSVLGLAIQLVLGLVLLVYGVVGSDHAAVSAAGLILLGVGIWLSLTLVYDQHKRERVEAIEAESLAGVSARQASVFETEGDELRVAARRLRWMYRFLVPGVSILLSAGLLALGFWRYFPGHELVNPEKFAAARPEAGGWALSLGLASAAIGFIFARYVAGMAKQRVWANLRAGAGAAVGIAVVGAALATAHFVHYAGSDLLLRWMPTIIPVVMIFLGAEIVLNLLLDIYRPRKKDDQPRPAFDSRVAALLASPDRIAESLGGAINYQFGVDVSGHWAYRLVSQSVLSLVLIVAFVLWLLSSLEVVEPHQRSLVLRSGKLVGEVGPGLHVHMPWPIEDYPNEDVRGVRRIDVMTKQAPESVGPILWTNEHKVEEFFVIVRPTRLAGGPASRGNPGPAGAGDSPGSSASGPGASAGSATGAAAPTANQAGVIAAVEDRALIAVEFTVFYNIKSPAAGADAPDPDGLTRWEQFAEPGSRETLIRVIASREAISYFGSLTEDELLGPGRSVANAELRRRVQDRLDKLNSGVNILSAAIEGTHPERETAADFERVVSNDWNRLGMIEAARSDAERTLTQAVGSAALARDVAAELRKLNELRTAGEPQAIVVQERKIEQMILGAGGRAASMLAKAEALRWDRHMTARGRAEAIEFQAEAYRAAPEIYRGMLYFDALAQVLRNNRIYITPPKVGMTIDLKESEFTNPLIDAAKPEN